MRKNFFSIIFFLLLIFSSNSMKVSASNINIDYSFNSVISDVSGTTASSAIITNSSGQVLDHEQNLNRYKSYDVSWNWAIPNKEQIKNGDSINFELPTNVQITSDITFNVTKDPGGPIVGSFTIKKGSLTGTLTFNNYLEQHPEINRQGVITIFVNGKTESDRPATDWYLNKVGWINQEGEPTWNIAVNPQENHYDSITIEDVIPNGQKIILNSIKVQYGHYDKNGKFIVEKEIQNSNNYTIIGNEIKFNFKNVNYAIQIIYNAKAKYSGILYNSVEADLTENRNTSYYTNSATIPYSGNGTMNGLSISSIQNPSKKASASVKSSLAESSSKKASLSVKSSAVKSSSKKTSSSVSNGKEEQSSNDHKAGVVITNNNNGNGNNTRKGQENSNSKGNGSSSRSRLPQTGETQLTISLIAGVVILTVVAGLTVLNKKKS